MTENQVFSGRSLLLVFSALTLPADGMVNRLSHEKVPLIPATWIRSSGFLDDARFQVESFPRLTDCYYALGGESEVGALRVGTYWLCTER